MNWEMLEDCCTDPIKDDGIDWFFSWGTLGIFLGMVTYQILFGGIP